MDDKIFPGNQFDTEAESLSARLMRLELMVGSFVVEHLYSPDETGTISQYEVLARRMGTSPGMQEALSPYFIIKDEKLYGLVAPQAMLSPDFGEIHRPVVPTLNGVRVDEDPPPRVALSNGKWWLMLKGGQGVASVHYLEELPQRDKPMHCADWVVLAEFTVEKGTQIKDLMRHNASFQHGLRRPGGFMPVMWRSGQTWTARSIGHIIDRTRMNPHKVELSTTVEEGDRFFVKVSTDFDGAALSGKIIHVKRDGDEPEDQQHLPTLSDQDGRDGKYHIPICRFNRTDEFGKDAENNKIFTIYPEMMVSGDIIWQPESYQNIGGGEGKLLKETNLSPRKLKVRSIKQGKKEQIKVVQLDGEVEIQGNDMDGRLIWESCEGYRSTLLEWTDGLITTKGDAVFKAGCTESSTDAPGP